MYQRSPMACEATMILEIGISFIKEPVVNLTRALLGWNKHPANRYWKRQRIFQYCAHFYGRRRNVYSVALRGMWKAWEHAQESRKSKKINIGSYWTTRIGAAAEELGIRGGYFPFVHGLARSDIALDKKVLADIAWSEPRTFRSLVDIARMELAKDPAQNLSPPENVIDTRLSTNESASFKLT